MRLFDLILRITVARHIFPWPFAKTIETALVLSFTFHGEAGFADQNDIAGAAFNHLELDGVRPDLVLSVYMKQHAAIARLIFSWLMCVLAPAKHHVQIVVVVLLLGDEVAELRTGNMYRSVLDAKDMIGIVVLPVLLEIRVESVKVFAVKQLELGAELGIRRGRKRNTQKQKDHNHHKFQCASGLRTCAISRDFCACRNASRSINSERVRLSSNPSGISEMLEGLMETTCFRGMRISACGLVTNVIAAGVS